MALISLSSYFARSSLRIVFVEDDERLSELIKNYLVNNGFNVLTALDGLSGERLVLESAPDIVILDLMLPGIDGMEVCRRIRRSYEGPVLFLTAQDDTIDEVAALEMGADDYIHKPVEPRVLLAKLRAVGRRLGKQMNVSGVISFGALEINNSSRFVSLDGNEIELSSTEYELLLVLAENAGKIMSRDELSEKLRGVEYDGLDRTIDISISRLRKKLNDCTSKPERIKTVWGKGYLFVKDGWER